MADRTEISLTQDQVDEAVKSRILTPEQGGQLWLFWKERQPQRVSHFDYISVLQYFGMAGVLVAMGHFVHSHHLLGNYGMAQISIFYAVLFFAFGYWLWKQPCYRFGGGLFLTLSVCMIPLLLYGIESGLGQWPQLQAEQLMAGEQGKQYDLLVRSHQIRLEAATVVGAMVMLNFFSFPLLLLPLVISGWLLFLDALPVLFPFNLFLWRELLEITAAYGAGVLLFAYKADRKNQSVFASWGYFLGLALSWSALTALIWDSSELVKGCYCLGNGVLLLLSFVFNRTVFLLFGALGVLGYFCYLAYLLFSNPFTFSFVISLISISALYLGVFFQKHQKRLFI
jgi:hypothetical protein